MKIRDIIKNENFSWSSLDQGLSIDDKLFIFEEHYINKNLTESVNENDKKYFTSLYSLSDNPIKNKKFITVPLSLIANRVVLLDKPELLTFLEKNNGEMIFKTSSGKKLKYPSDFIRGRAIYNTFTFKDIENYNKLRISLKLKFDTDLPDLNGDKDLEEKLTSNNNIDTWRDTFLKANPEQYHQFRQNNRPGTRKPDDYIIRMANRARYKAVTKKK